MIKLKSLLSERTLYHGTVIDNVPHIEKYGLIPQRGDFVTSAYGGEYADESDFERDVPELTFAADKQKLKVAVTAAAHHIAKKLNKDFHDVTDREFIRYAAILKIYDGETQFQQRPEWDERGDHPSSVEPGDYYSDSGIGVDEILTGNSLLRLLKRHGLWPRRYGTNVSPKTIRQKRDRLVKLGLRKGTCSKTDLIKKIAGLTDQEVNHWFNYYPAAE